MAITCYPFDSGSGANVMEDQWREMARLWATNGVLSGELNSLAVSQRGAGANMSVDVATGVAWVRGHYFKSDTVANVVVTANGSGNPRIDIPVVRIDFVANTGTFEMIAGTPAGSPSAPALTQSGTRWEIPLANIAVSAGASSIVNANITDKRYYINQPIRGSVSSAGAVSAGIGYTVVKSATGQYDVTFTTAFGATPTIVATPITSSRIYLGVNSPSTTGFRVNTQDNTGAAIDVAFNFIATPA